MTDPRYEILRSAMWRIAWPHQGLREYAKSVGHDFNAKKAAELANDAEFLKNIARDTMKELAGIDPAGINDPPMFPSTPCETPR